MTDPIKIFVGTEPKMRLPELVLGHSIRENTKRDVEIEPLDYRWMMPAGTYGTGFSLRRWMIPDHCGFKGRAIYLDADMLLVHDIGELWDVDLPTPVALCYKPDKFSPDRPVIQTSVMVIDCARARWEIPSLWGHLDSTYENYHWFMKGGWWDFLPVRLDGEWNSFNYHDEDTKLVHYTKPSTQPWWKPEHQYAKIWRQWLVRAVEAGAVTGGDLEESLKRGLHPSYRDVLGLVKS